MGTLRRLVRAGIPALVLVACFAASSAAGGRLSCDRLGLLLYEAGELSRLLFTPGSAHGAADLAARIAEDLAVIRDSENPFAASGFVGGVRHLPAVRSYFATLEQTSLLQRQSGFDAARRHYLSNRGQANPDQVVFLFSEMSCPVQVVRPALQADISAASMEWLDDGAVPSEAKPVAEKGRRTALAYAAAGYVGTLIALVMAGSFVALAVADRRERRARARVGVARSVTVLHQGLPVEATIRNVSPSGANLRCSADLAVGDDIVIDPDGLNGKGRVVWKGERLVGVRFERELDENLLRDYIAAPA